MNVERVAVQKDTKKFGLIVSTKSRNITVLWLDGTTSESTLTECAKVIFNSPTFYKEVSPERNIQLLEKDPNQLFLEILWEKKCNYAENASMDPKKIKEEMLGLGLPGTKWDKLWKEFKGNLNQNPGLASSHGNKYLLLKEDFVPADPLVVDWEAIRLTGSNDISKNSEGLNQNLDRLPLASPNDRVEVAGASKTAPRPASLPVTPLDIFALRATGEQKKNENPENSDNFLNFYAALSEDFAKLNASQRKQLLQNVSVNSSPDTKLIAHMLDSHVYPKDEKTYRESAKIGSYLFAKASAEADALTTSQRLAVSKLLEVLPDAATLTKPNLAELISSTSFILSLPSPALKDLKDKLSEQLASLAKKSDINYLSSSSERQLIAALVALGWDSEFRAQLNEVLINSRSIVVQTPDFWLGFKASHLIKLCVSPLWNGHLLSSTLHPVVCREAERLLQSVTASDALSLLAISNQLEGLLGEKSVVKLVLLALNGQSSTKVALQTIANTNEITALRSAVDAKTAELSRIVSEAQKHKNDALALDQKIASLEAKIAQAGEASESVRDGVKQQFALDAARKVVRILAFIDEQFGPEYEGKQRVLTLAKSLDITSFAKVGEIASFNFTHFDDHEGRSAEGDSVKVLASGYLWGSEDDSIVLLKAVVTN